MKTNQANVLQFNDIYYITQYANDYTDDAVFSILSDNVAKVDEEDRAEFIRLLIEICHDLMPEVCDDINALVYLLVIRATELEQVEWITELLNAVINADLWEVDELFNGAVIDFMYDRSIYTPQDLENIADNDLRINGIEARCLYWIKEIDFSAAYLELNVYENDFYTYNEEDIIHEFLTDFACFDDLI